MARRTAGGLSGKDKVPAGELRGDAVAAGGSRRPVGEKRDLISVVIREGKIEK